MTKAKYLGKEAILFLIGGLIYITIEIIARGYSHFSMFIVGGLCFVLIGLLNECYEWETPFQTQCLIGATIITILEFVSGCIVNLWLHLNVWDYSDRPFNLLGQICLHHSICYWTILSAAAIVLDDFIRYKLFKEPRPVYYITKKKKKR